MQIAEQMGHCDEWLNSANKTVVGSIGPTCSQTLREEGVAVSIEASPPKMAPLVRVVVRHIADA